jgi:RNA polymerase sigma factor (sigma-70 family)
VAEYGATRSPEAFNRIVERHGPMVLHTSLRLVGNWHDAEDVAQAVFLVLAQRAASISSALGGWLHKVTRDTSLQLLRAKTRRERREGDAVKRKTTPNSANEGLLREELDVALVQLPERMREAVVLRYLEGRGQEEAARLAGCDKGTLSRRCTEGLNRLEKLLSRRGVTVAPAMLTGFLTTQAPAALPAATLSALQCVGAGSAVASAQVAALAKGTLHAMFWAKAKMCAAVLTVTTAVATAGVVIPLAISRKPDAPSPAATVQRDLLLRFDFEDGKLPGLCTSGKVVRGPERAGNRFCLEGAPDPGHGHLVTLSKDDGLATYSDDLCLVFDIFVDAQVATVDMNLWNRTRQLDHGIEPLSFPRERWVEGVVVPFAEFKHGSARMGLKPGDSIINLRIHAGQPGGVIWIDNLEIVRSPTLRSSRPPK